MIAVRLSNKKLNPIVTELFNKRRKLHICLVFIPQSCFYEPKNIILNTTRYFTMEIQKRRTSATLSYSSQKMYWPYSFLLIDATLASNNPSSFRKKILERIKKLIMTIRDKIRDEKLY